MFLCLFAEQLTTNIKVMKKLLTLIILSISSWGLFAQTIVNTDVENRKAVLEEFTGIYCGYCPEGHIISYELSVAHPDDFIAIANHSGSYANPNGDDPDFRTTFGEVIDDFSNVSGYPTGNINRHMFSGTNQGEDLNMSRQFWAGCVEEVIAEDSYVNVGLEAEFDIASNSLSVHVEVYYTGDSPESTNFINLALLQTDVEGPQNFGEDNPNFILPNGNYSHQHMLRHLITGQWGEEITTTTTGSFIDLNYNYILPGDYREVEVFLDKLELVAYITETQSEIESGNKCHVDIIQPTNTNDSFLTYVSCLDETCDTEITPSISFRNVGLENITSLDIEYSVNGGTLHTHHWTGDLSTSQAAKIELAPVSFIGMEENIITATISSPNGSPDQNTENNSNSTTFNLPLSTTTTIYLDLLTDNYGEETSWKLFNYAGDILYSGGTSGEYTNEEQHQINETFELSPDCHKFVIYDSYGDGMNAGYGEGHYKLTDSEGSVIKEGGTFTSEETTLMNAGIFLNVENTLLEDIQVYPNPATNLLNIKHSSNMTQIELYNYTGSLVLSEQMNSTEYQMKTSKFKSGLYILKIMTDVGIVTKQVVIN